MEESAEAFPFRGMDRFGERHPPLEMQAEMRMRVAVLAIRTQPDAVGQRRFQTIEIGAAGVDSLVGDQAGQLLADGLAHDSRFAVMHGKTVFMKDRGDVGGESLHASFEFFPARKGQVVGVARIDGAGGFRHTGEAAVDSISAKIGERGRSRRALREMGPIVDSKFMRSDGRAEASQQIGHGFGISHGAEQRLHSGPEMEGKKSKKSIFSTTRWET